MDRVSSTSSPAGNVFATTDRDVVNGKGQGVQRTKGNVDYRTAVKAHKVCILSVPSLSTPPAITH